MHLSSAQLAKRPAILHRLVGVNVADKLLFILVYSRMYPLLIVQGMFFGVVESKACSWVGILLPVLDAALG